MVHTIPSKCYTSNTFELIKLFPEATYAYKMKKDIIPLLLQEGYVPEDWLGALLGMKKYFPMYSEEQLAANLPELIKELGDSGKSPQTHIMSPNYSRPGSYCQSYFLLCLRQPRDGQVSRAIEQYLMCWSEFGVGPVSFWFEGA